MRSLRQSTMAALALAGLLSTAQGAPPAPAATPLDQAVGGIKVPPGFRVSLFAGEPNIRQPIALTFDARGRLWVVECYSYPQWEMAGKPGKDRVLIFEDADGDGKFDSRTVFWDRGTNLSGIEVGFGGVWLCSTPNLVFIPDRDGDDSPDSEPEVVLDGWDLKARHNVFNGLTWAPDGWLWGCNGILSNSRVGKPGTPDKDRVGMNCGIWRYHPTRKVFEAVAHGTTNPWGLDFDDHGEAFLTNCVIPHLFHVIPGGHMQRMFGQDINPNSYALLGSCADHVHWDTAERWLDIRSRGVTPTTDKAGGGHAHSGAAICLSDTWPENYRNTVLMGNIHGNRLNLDRLNRKGSGYVATHEPDFMQSTDRWFRSVAQKFGPDGSLYVLDWSDTGECHEDDADGAHRENGRIYRVSYGEAKPFGRDLSKLGDLELVALQKEKNDAVVRQGRRILQERAAAGKDMKAVHEALWKIARQDNLETRKLRAIWALNATGGLNAQELMRLMLVSKKEESLRAWGVRLLVDDPSKDLPDVVITGLSSMAAFDESPRVHLALASALPRFKADDARKDQLIQGLIHDKKSADDANLPLMIWYGIEPTVARDLKLAAQRALTSEIPLLRRNLARRIVAADLTKGLAGLVDVLNQAGPSRQEHSREVLEGMADALQGRKSVTMPEGWAIAARRFDKDESLSLREAAWRLSLIFGDKRAVANLRKLLIDDTAPIATRKLALTSLAAARVTGVARDLVGRLDDAALKDDAIRALAAFDDSSIPEALLDRYQAMNDAEREDAVATLAARPAWALRLLDAVATKAIPRNDVSATIARQLQAFGRDDVNKALEASWGTLRPTAGDKAALISKYKAILTPDAMKSADLARGRILFAKSCQTCHKMYGEGGDVGPELTGSNRDYLDYLLENVLDPSASVGNDYKLVNIATTDGRLVSGIVKERTEAALVVRTPNDRVVIPIAEIEVEKPSPASMMPEGLFGTLTDDELRDLAAYLAARK